MTNSLGRRFIRPLSDFFHKEASAGILLILAALVALIWSNSPLRDSYFDLWNTHAIIGIDDFHIELTLKEWINDAAMVLFFFVVGLEIKRELTEGELRDPRQAALPIIAAIGGMAVPAVIYSVLNAGGAGSSGWGIPMATDIAIVMGVVALLGTRAPSWLKLFLLALAIVDDIGAILVIAIFYSEGVSFAWLAVAIAAVAVAAAIRNRVPYMGVFVLLGMICWLGLHEAHVHPTLAGVAFGLLTPVRPLSFSRVIDAADLEANPSYFNAYRVTKQARSTVSVLEWLEHRLHPYSAFVVVPIFALANAGVYVPFSELDDAFASPVTWGVILGLVVGKTVGITAFTMAAVALKVGKLPRGVTLRYVIGAATIAGIGFTVSLFVSELAFGEGLVGTEARLGVLVGSFVAALLGTAILVPGNVIDDHSMDEHTPDPGLSDPSNGENALEHVDAASSA